VTRVTRTAAGQVPAGHSPPLSIVGWHWALYGVALTGLVSAFALQELSTGQRVIAVALFLLLAASYTVLILPDPGRVDWHSRLYLSIASVSSGIAMGVHPALTVSLYLVYIQGWLFTRTVRGGLTVTAALSLASLLGFVHFWGLTGETLSHILPEMAVSTTIASILGWWVSRVVEQSQDRARLIDELTQARAELAEAHHAQGVMTERERVAREIHDTLAQGLTSILMLAQAATATAGRDPAQVTRRLAAIEDVARENLAEARALVAAFSPVGLEGSTLPEALRRLAHRFTEQTGAPVDVEVTGISGPLAREQEVVLLRAAQEALTNVRKHAHARAVTLRMSTDVDLTRVEIRDDGVGFEPAQADAGPGYGLAGMRARVAGTGGELDVMSAPGGGTLVRVSLPRTLLQDGPPS